MDSGCLLRPSSAVGAPRCFGHFSTPARYERRAAYPSGDQTIDRLVVASKEKFMAHADARSPRRLVDILRALPTGELDSLISRLGIPIVAAKRIDTPSQVARALVSLPEVRDPSRLPGASAELLHRIAEARGSLLVQSIPIGLEPLVARGIVFARMRGEPPPSSRPGAPSSQTTIEL